MLVAEFLIFSIFMYIIYYTWRKGKYLYLMSKIPNGGMDYSLSSLWKFFNADNKMLLKFIHMSIKHDGLTKTWNGLNCFVNVSDPEDIRKVLSSKRECIDKPHNVKLAGVEHGSVFGSVEAWRSHRRILNPFFTAPIVKNFIPLFMENSNAIVSSAGEFAEKGEFNVYYYNMILTLDTILNAMEMDFNYRDKQREVQEKTIHSFENGFNMTMLRFFKFWLQPHFIYKFTDAYKRETEARKVLLVAEEVIKHVRDTPMDSDDEDGKPKNFIRALMSEKNNLNDLEINHEVVTLLVAALDTGIALSTTLLMLAMHKEIQDKVLEEMQQVFGSDYSEIVSEDLLELRYLDMVINETMRLFPIVPFIARLAEEDMELGGYTIPAGANLIIAITKVHRDKKIWGEDANAFRPERFEEENFEKVHQFAFIPFSKGTRMCLGFRYALQLMKIHLVNILRRYVVETSLKLDDLEFQLAINMTVCQGYQISLKERKAQK